MTPEELVSRTAAPINALGATFYFHPDTLAKGKELGLDGFRFYILGRGGVLGDCEAPVVASAFGYFNQALVAKMWDSAREVMAPRDAARAYIEANNDLGRATLGDVEGLGGFCDAAAQVVADVNPAGLTLFAGVAAEPLPDDLPGRAMQLVMVHRELRGSTHLATIVGTNLDPVAAHVVRRPDDIETFGWPKDYAVPDGAADALAAVDVATDAAAAGQYGTLTDAQRDAFVAGVEAIAAAFE